MSNTDEVAHAPIQWYTPIKLSLPSLSTPPRCTTPLDPRGQTHIPLQDRLNARLTSKLRQKIPRLIPLEVPDADPRSSAQTPVAHPGMERVSRREQLQRRQKTQTLAEDPILAKIMKDMKAIHGKPLHRRTNPQYTYLTYLSYPFNPGHQESPLSPTPPQSSRPIYPRKAKTLVNYASSSPDTCLLYTSPSPRDS